jgi:thiosulfate/3-mercaptopyruvate sulfurtransferase
VSPFARPELFCSTDEVAGRLADPRVRIVDCRFEFGGDGHAEYLAAHIPGAVHCDWSTDIAAPPPPSGHPLWMLAGPEDFARAMERFGISNDTTVLAYDAEGGHHAARLWLGLRRYGHDACAVMEGGIQKWEREGRPLERGEVIVPPGRFAPHPRDGVIATKAEVLAAVRKGDPWLLDVRRESEYTGEEVRAARGGHIPGAVHVFWKDALARDWTLRDPDELDGLYGDAGFGPDTRTITYCQAGVRAAFTHLVLTALGRDDVRTYDGSWEEWGNDAGVPIVTGRS